MTILDRFCLVLALVALPGLAHAQTEEPIDLDNPGAEPATPASPPPAATASNDASPDDDDGTDDGVRPTVTSVGIGVGYSIPADVMAPNSASVRFRFASGLQIEPRVDLSTTRRSNEFMGADTDDETVTTEFSANLRYPLGTAARSTSSSSPAPPSDTARAPPTGMTTT